MNIEQKHGVFISYHHANDQFYKDKLLGINELYDIFIDKSVETGDVDDNLSDESIRTKIRDEYLTDSTVTILLVGTETWGRKHIDWEIYSSMYDGTVNKKSGILIINLPSTYSDNVRAGHGDVEKQSIHPNIISWTSLTQSEYEKRYRFMPKRIIDNLVTEKENISIVPWSLIESDPEKLRTLIEFANKDRQNSEYDLSSPMRRQNGDTV
jgi:Thoeris protein ThsB, TIR-like domain